MLQIRYEIFMNMGRIYGEIYMHVAKESEREKERTKDMLRILTHTQVIYTLCTVPRCILSPMATMNDINVLRVKNYQPAA